MGFGNVLGGIATGLQAGAQGRRAQSALDMQQQNMLANQDIAKQRLGIAQKQLAFEQAQAQNKQSLEPAANLTSMADQIWKDKNNTADAKVKALDALTPYAQEIDKLTGSNTLGAIEQYKASAMNGPSQNEPGTGGGKVPAASAGKVAMIDTALENFKDVRDILQKPWSAEDIAKSAAKAQDVGRAQRQVGTLIEAVLRMMTGAAVTQQEFDRYANFYMPNATDTPATKKQKLDLLVEFAKNARKQLTGQTAAPAPANAAPSIRQYNPETGTID